jgi:CDP-diacylglycerol---serine O-phosphatidyltransferase
LRLARFNAAIDDDKPRWQSNYFTGMPTPAAAIVVLLPVYLYHIGFEGLKAPWALKIVLVYTLFIAFMMVSTIPTFSGKLLGERVGREWVLPMFIVAIGSVAMLVTYPYETLTALTIAYLAMIPVSWRRYQEKIQETAATTTSAPPAPLSPDAALPPTPSAPALSAPTTLPSTPPNLTTGKIFPLRPGDPPR